MRFILYWSESDLNVGEMGNGNPGGLRPNWGRRPEYDQEPPDLLRDPPPPDPFRNRTTGEKRFNCPAGRRCSGRRSQSHALTGAAPGETGASRKH